MEFKDTEILQSRLANLTEVQPFIGKFFSEEWVRKNILHQTDKEIEDMMAQINAEGTNQPEPEPEPPEEQPSDQDIDIKTPVTRSAVPNVDGAGR